jgi:hypothetical protein
MVLAKKERLRLTGKGFIGFDDDKKVDLVPQLFDPQDQQIDFIMQQASVNAPAPL